MKFVRNHFLLSFFWLFSNINMAQVLVDKPIQLSAPGADAKIEGIKSVTQSQDAVSAEVVQKSSLTFALASGTPNALLINLSPAISAYVPGQMLSFQAAQANSGAITINVNGLGARSIKKNGSSDLAANDLKPGQMVAIIYDGVNFQMISQLGNTAGGSVSLSVGDVAQGGKVLAVWNGGQNGVAVATSDESGFYCPWQAFTACGNKTTGGMYDWQLPPGAVLNLMYTNRTSIGGFSTDYYWGTDRHSGNTDGGYAKSFLDGSQYVPCNGGPAAKVRCIRFF